jgi:transglutaminase-like putative cysteine protease
VNYRVRHSTRYTYSQPVAIAHNEVRLTPRSGGTQQARRTQLSIDPAPSVLSQQPDFFGNTVHFFTLQAPHHEMTVTAVSDVTLWSELPPAPAETAPWERVRDALRHDLTAPGLDAYQFVFESPYVQWDEETVAYAAPSFPAGRPLLEGALDLTRRIHADFKYEPGATSVATPVADVLKDRRGVCQDFTHLEIACLRSLGLAARYVSGYVLNLRRPSSGEGGGKPAERMIGADASHAWLSVYDPATGWIDLDPTNDTIPTDQHVTVAWGRDYGDVSPVKGVILGGGQHTVAVAVDVVPVG